MFFQFVCLGGKEKRMKGFAEFLYETLGEPENSVMEEGNKNSCKIQKYYLLFFIKKKFLFTQNYFRLFYHFINVTLSN